MRRGTARNLVRSTSGKAAAAQLIVAIATLLSGILAARLLSLDERGTAASIVAIVTMIVYVCDMGTSVGFVHFGARDQTPYRAVGEPVVWLLGTASLALALLVVWQSGYPLSTTLLTSVGIYVVANTLARASMSVLYSQQMFSEANLCRIAQASSFLAVSAAALALRPKAEMLVAAFAVSWTIQAAAAIFFYLRLPRSLQVQRLTLTARFWKYAIPVHLSGQNVLDAWRIEIVIGSVYLAPAEIAVLAICSSYAAQARFIAISVSPLIQVRGAASQSGETERQRRTLAAYIVATIGSSLVLTALAPVAIPLLFGPGYGEFAAVAGIYAIAAGFSSVRAMVCDQLRGHGRVARVVVVESGAAVAATAMLLTPQFQSVYGYALSVLVAHVVGAALAVTMSRVRNDRGSNA